MAKKLGNLVLQLQLENASLMKRLDSTEKKVARFQKRTSKMASAFRDAFTNVMIPALTAFGAISGRTFAEFEDTMLRVQAVSGASAEEFVGLTEAAKEMGRTTRFTASQAAEGLQFLSMAGLQASESMEALDETLQLALISGGDMARAADILTNVMTGFNLAVSDLSHVNDVLAQSITSSNQNLEEQAQALSKVAGIAPATNQSLEDMTAITQVLANQGIKAEEAGTAIRMMLVRLIKPTNNAMDIFNKYGIALQNVDGSMRPLIQIMEDFAEKGVSQNEILEVFGARAGPKFIAALSAGTDSLRLMSAELSNANGAAANMAATIDSGLKANFLELKSKVEDLMISMGSEGGFGEMLNVIIDDLKTLVDVIKANALPAISALAQIWTFVAAAMEKTMQVLAKTFNFFVDVAQQASKVIAIFSDEAAHNFSKILDQQKLVIGVDDRSFTQILEEQTARLNERANRAMEVRKAEESRKKSAHEAAKADAAAAEALDNVNQSLENNRSIITDEGEEGVVGANGRLTEEMQRLKDHGFAPLKDTADSVSESMASSIQDAARSIIVDLDDIGSAFENMGRRIFNTLANSVFDQTVGNFISQSVAGLGIDSFFQGFFAKGGSVEPNKAAIVGEEGPELFVPSTAGTIVPNSKLGGMSSNSSSVTVVQNISISPDVPSTTRRVILEQLPMIKEAAARGVEDKVLRGGQYSKNIRGN